MTTPDRSTVQSKLGEFILDEVLLRDEPLESTEDLFDAGFDSMSLSRVLVFVEEEFGVLIPDQEVVLEELSTLDKMTDFVKAWIEKPKS